MRQLLIAGFTLLILSGCADKYLSFTNHYTFKSETGAPDYSNLFYWAAHPAKWDPSDSIPQPLMTELKDSLADVFFIHPTTFTKKQETKKWNASIDDEYINSKTDYSTILYQASVFNERCRIFAPRYRQAHLSAFYNDGKEAAAAFDLAYADIKHAFEYYLAHENKDRPIIIAAHSQGSKHALRLLKEFFEDQPLQKQLVVAYVIGWPLPLDYSTSIPVCKDSTQTGCICSWRTFREGYEPAYVKNDKQSAAVTNPLSWQNDEKYMGRKFNKGSVLTHFDRVIKNVTGARIHENVLWIPKPKFPGGLFYGVKNYHIADYNLFYMNVRENVSTRLRSFFRQSIQ
jgi:hypothetical protein